jgi:DNA-binding SARP family transcriptional activator/tetratricopeptide (TPR) repeat protein
MIAVRVLGPLEVAVDGVLADSGGPRQRCVLARLVAEHGRAVSADRLIEDLYTGEPPPRALAGLQAYVSHLRRILEPGRAARAAAGVLVTSPPGYALRLDCDAVDAWAFQEQVGAAVGMGDAAAVHDRLSTALGSWRGRAYQEFTGLPWADLEASRLEELRLAATEWRVEAALRLGRAAEVIADLDRFAADHPLREEAWRLLALALYQTGRQGDALAALRRARTHLAGELGVDPGPALRELEGDILAQAPHLSASPPLSPRGRTRVVSVREPVPGSAPYVGRDAELAQVMRAAADVAAGRMRIVLVAGEAGAGKTALAAQISQRLAERGWTVAAGHCPEDEGAPPAWPWAQALRRLAGAAAEPGPRALAPLLADSLPLDGDVAAARFALHRAVAGYLEAASAAAPLLVVLDDLHRADGETLAILASITADLTASKTLVLGTYRPGETSEPLSDCLSRLAGREPVRVSVGGLDAAAAAKLIRATCERGFDDETARVITERCGGNPFFLKEIARLLDSEGALAATSAVPAGVRDVLARRIARLPATAQTILRQAAVIGIETSIDVVADVSGALDDVVLDAVEAGLVTGLVTEPATGRIRFAHALVRDTLYDSLSRSRRARLHAHAARAIERHHPADVAALAHHFTEAGTDPATADRYCRLAAHQAEQRFAFQEAARLWEQAIACSDQAGAPARERLEPMLGLVRALGYTGQPARARSLREHAIRVAQSLADPALLARVITAFDVPTLWPAKEYGVTDHELIGMVDQTLAALPPGEQVLRCRLLTTLALELVAEPSRGYQASARAVKVARRIGDPAVLTMALNGSYVQSYQHDGLDERLRMGTELLALPGKPVTSEALAHLILMMAHSSQGCFSEADLHADAAAGIASRYDLPIIASRVSFYRAMRTALTGDPCADETYQQAAELMSRLGMWQHGAALSVLGRFCLLVMQGNAAEIAPELELLYNYPPLSAPTAELYALSLAASGRADQARVVAGQPQLIRRDPFWLFKTGVRGLLAVAIGDRDRAESAYHGLLPFAERPTGADTGAITLWPAAQILGDLARYLHLPDARAHYERALAIAEQAKVPAWTDAARGCLTPSG